jgi:hypothetical protein
MFTVMVVAFSVLLLIALISIASELVMRIRLSGREEKEERLLWWRRGGDEVASEYQKVFPQSFFPRFRVYAFLGFLVVVLVLSVIIVLRPGLF